MFLKKTLLACGIFLANVHSAFIEAPIPPSEKGNFFEDADGDGTLDHVRFTFLGKLSRKYLDSSVQSLSFKWFGKDGNEKTFTIPGTELPFHESSPSVIEIPISAEDVSPFATSLSSGREAAEILFFDSSSMAIPMGEKIAPKIKSAILFSSESGSGDSLSVFFSEAVRETSPGKAFIECKHAGELFEMEFSKVTWDASQTSAKIARLDGERFPAPGDSLRILQGSLSDSSGNTPSASAPFREVFDIYPFRWQTSSLALAPASDSLKASPIFERQFLDTAKAAFPENSLGVAMVVGGKDFKAYVERFWGSSGAVSPDNLHFSVSLQIYTRTGEYVTSVHSTTKCSDARFPGGNCFENPRLFFLKWNLMANDRRLVGTGTYLVKISASVRYKDFSLWQSPTGKGAVKIWGVKRQGRGGTL